MVDFIDTRDTSLSKFSIPVQRRITLAVLLLIGVGCVLLGYNTSGADFWRAAFITYVILMIALLKSPKKIVQERENNKEAVTDFVVKFLMGVRENVEVQFKQYDIDLMTPTRIQVNIPPLAKEEHLKGFLEQLTERFGKTRDWIKDTKTGNGWDTSTHTLDVRMTPPIPAWPCSTKTTSSTKAFLRRSSHSRSPTMAVSNSQTPSTKAKLYTLSGWTLMVTKRNTQKKQVLSWSR